MHNAAATVNFYILILLSSTIAYFSLLQDSGAVVIGAMLVAPLMSPMIAMAHSIVMGNQNMLMRAAISTLAGIGITIVVSALFALILPYSAPTAEILARTTPNIFDLVIAMASGAAGAYALSRKEVAAAMPGVAISAALVPPLCADCIIATRPQPGSERPGRVRDSRHPSDACHLWNPRIMWDSSGEFAVLIAASSNEMPMGYHLHHMMRPPYNYFPSRQLYAILSILLINKRIFLCQLFQSNISPISSAPPRCIHCN